MAIDHPDLSELLLFGSRELTEDRAKAVGQHISSCRVCQSRLLEVEFLKEDLLEIHTAASQFNLQAALDERKQRLRKFIAGGVSPRWMAATASAVITALLFFTLTEFTPAARAEMLLSKAASAETAGTVPRYLEIASGASQYLYAIGTVAKPASFPGVVIANFRAAGWKSNNPLSAKSFLAWRKSLHHKHDSLRRVAGAIEITTSTSEGAIHKAMLRIRTSDDRPIAGEFQFSMESHLTAVMIAEGKAPSIAEITPPVSTVSSGHSVTVTPAPAVDPLDKVEAEARLRLHKLDQDTNILLAVQREQDKVKVWGAVPDEATRAQLGGTFTDLPAVKLAISTKSEQGERDLPWKPYWGDTTPLAHDELQSLFSNDLGGRQNLLNEVDQLTRRIIAEARTRDGLIAVAARIRASEDSSRLHRASADVESEMIAEITQLQGRLQPFIGAQARQAHALSYEDAVKLYTLVHELLFLGRSQDPVTLEKASKKMRSLLAAS